KNGRSLVIGKGDVNHDFALTRLDSNGAIDPSFGTGGSVAVDFGSFEYDGDLALQPDGKLVLVGSTNVNDGGDIAVARLNGDPLTGPPGGTGTGGGTTSTGTHKPVPPPVSGKSVDVAPVSGNVLVKLPGRKGFTTLRAGDQIP